MSSYIRQSLAPGEELVAMFRLHWLVWVRTWITALVGAIIIAFVLWLATVRDETRVPGWVALVVAVVTVVMVMVQRLKLSAIEQAVTNHRVIRKTGFVARHSTEVRLASIETIDLRQSVTGRVFGFANIEITGRGETAMTLEWLTDPIGVKRSIETAYSQHIEYVHADASK